MWWYAGLVMVLSECDTDVILIWWLCHGSEVAVIRILVTVMVVWWPCGTCVVVVYRSCQARTVNREVVMS